MAKPKSKLIVSVTDQLNGAEHILFELAKYLEADRIIIFGKKNNNVWEDAGLNVNYSNGNIFMFFKQVSSDRYKFVISSHLLINSLLGLFRVFRFLKTDLLICRESTSIFKRAVGLKKIKYKMYYWIGYRKIDLLITQSDLMQEQLTTELPNLFKRINIRTIPNFFIPQKGIINKDRIIDKQYIVSAGRLIPEKGFDILIDAFIRLSKSYPKLILVILGEGEQRDYLENKIQLNKLEEKVLLMGYVENVYPYFHQAELCVVSSRIEGFPNVLLQMISQNTNVVSTLCAGGIESIIGLDVCDPNDSIALEKTIEKALSSDKSNNRTLFDKELEKRSIQSFVHKMFNKATYIE